MKYSLNNPRVIIITGHYGTGKTNLAVNLAIWLNETSGDSVTVADLDIVNPYFRTADFKKLFKASGIRLAASDFAGSSLDIPSLNLDIEGELSRADRLIIDVGGDAEGAKALGRFAPVLNKVGYEMVYVINKYRYLTQSPEQAVKVMRDIEKGLEFAESGGLKGLNGLKCTSIFNNSHLGGETTREIIAESVPFAERVAEISGLPLLEIPVKVYVKPIWCLE